MVDTTKSAPRCLADNDFEAALYRFNHTTGRWTDYWWETLETIFNRVKSLAKEYILDPITKTVQKIKTVAEMIIPFDTSGDIEGNEKVYLFKFFDDAGQFLFSKIGTTTRKVSQRMKEEIRYYRKHDIDVGNAIIESVYDCNGMPAEGAESICRAMFIREYPKAYHKNDRFFGVNIPVDKFNATVEKYLVI